MIILIADDFEEHRLLMKQMAEKRGHRVVEATNGQEAIDAAEREPPDLVLLDLALPVFDGLTVARRIREGKGLRGPVIVAVTAYDTYGLREAAMEAGCDEFIAKPVEADELYDLLDHLLTRGE
jgi:CheY-like chemotaxis protein